MHLIAQRLRNILRLNAVTSTVGGLIAVIAAGPLDRLLGTGQPGWVRATGGGLVVFAGAVTSIAGARASTLARLTPLVIMADVAWVLASAATIAAGWFSFGGGTLVAAVTLQVGSFAVLQTRQWRRLGRYDVGAIDESPPVEYVHSERRVHVDAGTAWRVVTAHELYGRLAPNLAGVHAHSGNGPDLSRTCTSRGGKQWSEACTLWDEGKRFAVSVDTSDYPYPLAVMEGEWWVEPDGDHCVVGMDFRYQPHRTVRGRVFAALMQAAFPFVLRRILNGWERAMTPAPTTQPLDA